MTTLTDIAERLAALRPEVLRTLREIARGDDQRNAERAQRLLKRHEPRPPSPLIQRLADDSDMRRSVKHRG